MTIDNTPPREDLVRFARFDDRIEVRSDPSGRPVLHGYAAVWDSPTTIDSWEGTFTEKIVQGAFKRTGDVPWGGVGRRRGSTVWVGHRREPRRVPCRDTQRRTAGGPHRS